MFRRHCSGSIPSQCCLESLRQQCTGFLPVQCCPKSVTTILNSTSVKTLFEEAKVDIPESVIGPLIELTLDI